MRFLEWLVLLPLWRRVIRDPKWHVSAATGTGILWIVIIIVIIAVASGGGGDDDETEAVRGEPATTATVEAEPTEEPTEAPEPTPEPTVEATPESTSEPTPTPMQGPVVIEGFGRTATDPVTPSSSISVATFTHNGSSNFIVYTVQGGEGHFLVNVIGSYQGSRPIFGDEPITFDIDADGAWTLRLEAIGVTDSASFSGTGDAVSGLFEGSSTGTWEVFHDGQDNFTVFLHCANSSDVVQNEVGAVSGSTSVDFGESPCLWEVQADGNWSLRPR